MGKWIRRLAVCITLLCLLWGGAWIADLVQIEDHVLEYASIENPDAEDFAQLKQKICDIAEEYGAKARELVIDGLVFLDHAVDYLLERAGVDPQQENIFSAD